MNSRVLSLRSAFPTLSFRTMFFQGVLSKTHLETTTGPVLCRHAGILVGINVDMNHPKIFIASIHRGDLEEDSWFPLGSSMQLIVLDWIKRVNKNHLTLIKKTPTVGVFFSIHGFSGLFFFKWTYNSTCFFPQIGSVDPQGGAEDPCFWKLPLWVSVLASQCLRLGGWPWKSWRKWKSCLGFGTSWRSFFFPKVHSCYPKWWWTVRESLPTCQARNIHV